MPVTLDPRLAAATALHRSRGASPDGCSVSDQTYQLQLAHVLLDGGYDGVATLGDVLAGGDHGLGTVDRLDGELVIVDGEPWRIDSHGVAELMPAETRTPFAIVSSLDDPKEVHLDHCTLAEVQSAIEVLVDAPDAVLAVRLEGAFDYVHVRSVPAQDPPYRPYLDVCKTDEVSWHHRPFFGVFVGFRFPDLDPGATIPGLHLHGIDRFRTTGGHNYDLIVRDAKLSVGVSRDVMMHLPDRSMVDMLEAPDEMRAVQRQILREGPMTIAGLAVALGVSPAEVTARLEWLGDRGFVEEQPAAPSEPRWAITLTAPGRALPPEVDRLLEGLY